MPHRSTPISRICGALMLLAPALLAGCGQREDAPAANSRAIACGPLGAKPDQQCRLEVEDRNGTLHLTLRQPEGGFRRLLWPKGGMLTAADGAEPLEAVPIPGGGVEARIGGWSYRIEKQGGGLP